MPMRIYRKKTYYALPSGNKPFNPGINPLNPLTKGSWRKHQEDRIKNIMFRISKNCTFFFLRWFCRVFMLTLIVLLQIHKISWFVSLICKYDSFLLDSITFYKLSTITLVFCKVCLCTAKFLYGQNLDPNLNRRMLDEMK